MTTEQQHPVIFSDAVAASGMTEIVASLSNSIERILLSNMPREYVIVWRESFGRQVFPKPSTAKPALPGLLVEADQDRRQAWGAEG